MQATSNIIMVPVPNTPSMHVTGSNTDSNIFRTEVDFPGLVSGLPTLMGVVRVGSVGMVVVVERISVGMIGVVSVQVIGVVGVAVSGIVGV